MKHFSDKLNTMSKQVVDSAVIVDGKGNKVGSISVRYTDAQIGWNNETCVLLYTGLTGIKGLDYGNSIKGDCYDQGSVFKLLTSVGARVYGHRGKRFYSYEHKEGSKCKDSQNVDSISSCNEFQAFTINRKKFKILWV